MKVKELIKELEKMPQDIEVVIHSMHEVGDYTFVSGTDFEENHENRYEYNGKPFPAVVIYSR